MPSWVLICAASWLLVIFVIVFWNYCAHSDSVPTPTFFLVCRGCGKRAYLIRNLCADCDPHRHIQHEAELTMMGKLSSLYEAETGKIPTEDWDNFDDWINS